MSSAKKAKKCGFFLPRLLPVMVSVMRGLEGQAFNDSPHRTGCSAL